MIAARRFSVEVWTATAAAIALTCLAFRAGRLLTFDGYYYCELAKRYVTEWPDRFGFHWPLGFPMAGALLARVGLPPYLALVLVSAAGLAGWLFVAGKILGDHPLRLLVLLTLGAAPIVAPQLGGVLTELPFAALLLALAFGLARWPARSALFGSGAVLVLALSVRYAGILAFAVMLVWLVVQARELHAAGRLRTAIVAWVLACALAGLLLATNVVKSGSLSGATDRGSPGLAELPLQIADFGWSAPSAFIAGGVRDLVNPDSAAGLALGTSFFAALMALCALGWWRPASKFSRPLALLTVGYSTGMPVLRCISSFDALYNARTFLPVLAPVVLLAVEQLGARRTWITMTCLAVIATGTTAALRGISRQIGADVGAAVGSIRDHLQPGDEIAINENTFAVSAYLAPVTRLHRDPLGLLELSAPERWVIIAGKPTDRHGGGGDCPPAWADSCALLVAQGKFRYLVQTAKLIALERVTPGPSPAR